MSGLPNDFLDRAWRELEERDSGGNWSAIRLPESAIERKLLLALDENHVRHLLVPAGPGRYSVNTRSPLSVGVDEQRFESDDGAAGEGRYLVVLCRDPKLVEQVYRVVVDAIGSYEHATVTVHRAE